MRLDYKISGNIAKKYRLVTVCKFLPALSSHASRAVAFADSDTIRYTTTTANSFQGPTLDTWRQTRHASTKPHLQTGNLQK
jgi:hypothetical protein